MAKQQMLHSLTVLIALSTSVVTWVEAAEPIAVGERDFAEARKIVLAGAADQPWKEVPWGTSLWKARQMAAAAGKPILLWEMDGHPLGCT